MKTSTSFDSWLTTDTRQYHDEDAVEERVKELMKSNADYDCTLFANFSEDVFSATTEQAKSVEEYLRSRDFEKLGRLLWCISFENREQSARIHAQEKQE